MGIHDIQRRLQVIASNIFEIDIDAFWCGLRQGLAQIAAGLVINNCVCAAFIQ